MAVGLGQDGIGGEAVNPVTRDHLYGRAVEMCYRCNHPVTRIKAEKDNGSEVWIAVSGMGAFSKIGECQCGANIPEESAP